MNKVHNAMTWAADSQTAGRELGKEFVEAFGGAAPDAIVVFASAKHDYPALLAALADEAGTEMIAGASSAGEFTQSARGEGVVSAMAIRSDEMQFALAVGRDIASDPRRAAGSMVDSFNGVAGNWARHRSALVMTDALAGHTDALVEELTVRTGGSYRFFGGGAGDDGRFEKTHVFAGREAYANAAVALEILSSKPVGIGVSHGWEPVGEPLRVTEASGATLVSLNGAPAVEAFKSHAESTGQRFDLASPLPFFLHNVLGIKSPEGHRLRVPLAIGEGGAIACAAAIPEGAIVHIMQTSDRSAVLAARHATRSALAALDGLAPAGAFVFDCVATRLRLGRAFEDELAACASALGPGGFVGCNTYGQIARADGQFGGFHNCTAVVCVLPQ
ncbi:FIST signal transduction protein [Hydrogenophaga intermedia]|uniref:FIST signal transduction protein n=1 Tax=Hydrogenophaga intermedia TaxID=65786 RepID=UPI002044AA63|nr:FIST N-terminal domain-containing protein [Hydrogenophaga intermedia]MCM3566025.1 FIST C-terminal domain-containing protein [Hydrogenophaga intermedia]